MKFSKYHALGNDYVVVEHDQFQQVGSPEMIQRICTQHFGIGADGILVREAESDGAGFRVRILNADGSEAEKSGNGLRIFARYLWDFGLVADQPFSVMTQGGPVTCQVSAGGKVISVDMGRVSFNSHDIPVAGPPREVLQENMPVDGESVEYSAASIGNPHCVVIREKTTSDDVKKMGPLIETEARFPNLTNVQFLEIIDRGTLRIEIWERGVGYTLASGTSSCAAAAVARRLDLCDPSVTVHMPGGELRIEFTDQFDVRMTGPVVKVAQGELCDEIFGEQAGI